MPIFNHWYCVPNSCRNGETNFSYNAYFCTKKGILRDFHVNCLELRIVIGSA
jgi:hypothetical protein